MKEIAESFHVVVERTGGAALMAVLPVIPVLLVYSGLQAVGRSFWSKGTEHRRRQLAREILDAPSGFIDPYIQELAQRELR